MPRRKRKKYVAPWHDVDTSLPIIDQLRQVEINIALAPKIHEFDFDYPIQFDDKIGTVTRQWCKEAVHSGQRFELLNILMFLHAKLTPNQVMKLLNVSEAKVLGAINLLDTM